MSPYVYPVIFLVGLILLLILVRTLDNARMRRKADRTDDPEEAHRLRMHAQGRSIDGSKLSGKGTDNTTGYGGF